MFYTLLLTYVFGGLTFIPLLILFTFVYLNYTLEHYQRPNLEATPTQSSSTAIDLKPPPTLKSWIIVRRTFEPTASTSYISIVRTLLESRNGSHRRADDSYYAVLKGSVVYLYDDEPMTECSAAIDITKCVLTIYPSSNLMDGELFAKRNALLLKENSGNEEDSLLTSPWYMFFKSVSVMEDWYLALLAAQKPTMPTYPYVSHAALITSLDALPDLIPTRWLNAILGRLFLAVKGTTAVEAWVIARLMKKLNKIKKPSFLTSVVVRSFEAGDIAPVLSKPMLKELTPEGEASIGVDVSYEAPPGGEIRITVSATATFSLPSAPSLSLLGLGSGKNKEKDHPEKDKPYEVSLVLAVVLRRLSGNMLIKVKRPPSNRIWYCFTTMPQMEMTIEPVVSDRQIKWGMVLSVIESKLREVIQESVVLPYMDDIPFFDTSSFENRGGLFPDAFKQHAGPAVSISKGAPAYSDAVSDASDTDSSKVPNDSLVLASLSDSDGGSSLGHAEPTLINLRKRKAWFGRKDPDTVGSQNAGVPSTHKRGKSLDGFSSPTTDISVVVMDEGSTATPDSKETQQTIRRAQSHNSRILSETATDSSASSSFEPITSSSGLSRSAPSSSPISSSAPSAPQPTTNVYSGSLLATLKSRGAVMAERPKEAMKKWGVNVNWGTSLRKADKEQDKTREKVKDDWELDTDHGELWGFKDEKRDTASGRTSYAEVRRKVEAREKERVSALGTPDNEEQTRATRSMGTKPIDIPGILQTPAIPFSPPAVPDTPRHASPSPVTTTPAPFLSPSAPRTTTELHTSTHVVTLTPPRDREVNDRQRTPTFAADSLPDVEVAPAVPIRAQPRAATMVIPGIHISHRNDVMALSSEPAAPQPKETSIHTPLSTPALGGIQSGWRLFRGDTKDHEEKKGTGILALPGSISSPPPPLPPRKLSAEIDRPSHNLPPTTIIETHPPDFSATRVLDQVVEQDAARKPPPLPARKITPFVVPRLPSSTTVNAVEDELLHTRALPSAGINTAHKHFESTDAAGVDDHEIDVNSSSRDSLMNNSAKPPLPPRRPTNPLSSTKDQ